MNCQETRSWMSPYLDSELGKTKTFEVAEHLRRCPECADRFDRERAVDDAMRSRLAAPTMPAEQWADFRNELTAPSWIFRLASPRNLAMAACVGIVLVASYMVVETRTGQMGVTTITERFLREASDDLPFPANGSDRSAIDELLRTEFGVRFATAADVDATGHWDFQLISARYRSDADGRAYLDLRLNCCGQPVLVTLARPADGQLPAAFSDIDPVLVQSPAGTEGVKLARATMGGVHVVAVSRHAVQHVIDGIRLVAT